MQNSEYQNLAEVTENKNYEEIFQRLSTTRGIRLLHAQLGLHTEGGELADALKRHLFYGKPLDPVNIAEEIGDVFWYLAVGQQRAGHPV